MTICKGTLGALAAACALAACGGDNPHDTQAGTGAPATPQAAALTIRPHLGTVAPGATGIVLPLGGGPAIPFLIGAGGEATVQIPAERCGPGMLVLQGGAQTRYFDEAANTVTTLLAGDNLRKLVADVCGALGPVPMTQLDELALRLPSDDLDEVTRALDRLVANIAADAKASSAAQKQAAEAVQAALDKANGRLSDALGLPAQFKQINPTPISAPGTALPATDEGHLAAVAQALARANAAARQEALAQRALSLEAAAALRAEQIAEMLKLAQQMSDAARARMLGGVVNALVGSGSPATVGYADNPAALQALKAQLGPASVRAAQDIPGLLQRTLDGFPATDTQRERIGTALATAAGSRPVANTDLTMVMQGALAALFLRAEPRDRLDAAVRDGQASFACTANGVGQGTVSIAFVDQDTSGALSHGDIFSLAYENCLSADPLSGHALVKSGAMQMVYAEPEPGGLPTERYAEVTMDVSLRSTGASAAAGTPLFRVEGTWQDRMAFDAPGEIVAPEIDGTRPAVLIRQPLVTLWHGDSMLATQGLATRLDLSPDFSLSSGAGKAALHVGGMVSSVFFSTPATFVFGVSNGTAVPAQGAMTFDRQYGGTGTGSLEVQADGRLAVTLTDGAGTTSSRQMTWNTLVERYLAP